MINRLVSLFHKKPALPVPRVQTTEDGIQVVSAGEILASVQWCHVKKIITYKYDLLTTDVICVGFLTEKDAHSWLEISEDWHGFREATDRMESRFPSIPKDWFVNVMVPAFERRERVLYEGGS